MKYILRRDSKEFTIFVQGEYWEDYNRISKQGADSFKNKAIELLFFKNGNKEVRFGGWYDFTLECNHRLSTIERRVKELARNIPSTNWFFWKKLLKILKEIDKDKQRRLNNILEEGQLLMFAMAVTK